MPRTNPHRPLKYEQMVADTIRRERKAANLTYESLAYKMTEAGYPIHGSSIFKIEKGTPPRRITVDEFVGFATVFGLSLGEMISPEHQNQPHVEMTKEKMTDVILHLTAELVRLRREA